MILYNKITKIGDYVYINKKKEGEGEIAPSPSLPSSLIIYNKKLLFIYHFVGTTLHVYLSSKTFFFF